MKNWLSTHLPDRETLLARRWMRPFAHRLVHPSLWHFNRWSVSRGIALGLFVGLLIPFGQIVLAALFALTLRANLLAASAATLVSNPLTFPAIYFAAYGFGSRVLTGGSSAPAGPSDLPWLIEVSAPTALGLFVFATAAAAIGYGAVHLAWKAQVRRRWKRRRIA